MQLLKKENWWIWLILILFGGGATTVVLGAMLDLLDKKAWYAKWYIWVICILVFNITYTVFNIQITAKTACKLGVKGSEYYLSPYIWIILIIIPVLGWIAFVALYLYLNIAILIKLHDGFGEKYIS